MLTLVTCKEFTPKLCVKYMYMHSYVCMNENIKFLTYECMCMKKVKDSKF